MRPEGTVKQRGLSLSDARSSPTELFVRQPPDCATHNEDGDLAFVPSIAIMFGGPNCRIRAAFILPRFAANCRTRFREAPLNQRLEDWASTNAGITVRLLIRPNKNAIVSSIWFSYDSQLAGKHAIPRSGPAW